MARGFNKRQVFHTKEELRRTDLYDRWRRGEFRNYLTEFKTMKHPLKKSTDDLENYMTLDMLT